MKGKITTIPAAIVKAGTSAFSNILFL